MKLAIFPNDNTISIVYPAPNSRLTFDEIIKKSVPTGVPYLIIDSSELPTDTEFRDAWQADFSNPDGYGA